MDLSLVIAAHGRPRALRRLLESLSAQTVERGRFDVIVVDDGTPEPQATEIRKLVEDFRGDGRYLRQEGGGPARARNAGVEAAAAPLVLFLNNDVILAPKHLERHLEAHARHPEPGFAAHGETRWHPAVLKGPVMECLRRQTFNYDAPIGEHEKPYVYFITSSLSLKRPVLLEHRFDESFRDASFEDTELAVRLIDAIGLEVELLRGDPALHWHYHTARDYLRRCALNGRNAVHLLERVPKFHERLIGVYKDPPPKRRLPRAMGRYLRGDRPGFWEELGTAVYVRAFWKERRCREM